MVDLHIYDVIKRPVVTEKSTIQADDLNDLVGQPDHDLFKEAIEVIFDVTVEKVRTMVQPAKRGRRGRAWYVRHRQWKKAVVTLAEGNEIDLFNP